MGRAPWFVAVKWKALIVPKQANEHLVQKQHK